MIKALPFGCVFIGARVRFNISDLFAVIQFTAVFIHQHLRKIRLDDAALYQVFGVFLPRGFHASNGFVHHRLGRRGLISLVVTVPAIADQVYYDITVKLLAKITGNFHDMMHRFRVIGIHVKNGCMHHLGDGSAIQC